LRGRSYGIILAGALLTALPLLIFSRAMGLRHASLERNRSDRISAELCQSLAGAELYLAMPRSLEGAGAMSRMGELLTSLELTPLPPGSPQGAAAFAKAGSSKQPPNAANHREFSPTHSCPKSANAPQLTVVADPADPAQLLIGTRTSQGQGGEAWLRLNTRALLDGEGTIRQIRPGEAGSDSGLSEGTTPQRLWFADTCLLLLPAAGEEQQEGRLVQALAWSLGGLALALTTALALRSEAESQRQRQKLAGLRLDSQSGLLSRLALEEDLGNPTLGQQAQGVETLLLAMVNLRLLRRQRTFLRDGEIRSLFNSVRHAVAEGGPIGAGARFYRASENRLAVLLFAKPGDDQALLDGLYGRIRAEIQTQRTTRLRDNDILITAQRLAFGAGDISRLDLHGYSEILALEERRSLRLIEAGDANRVMQKAAIRDQLQTLTDDDIELVFQPILLLSNPGQFGLEVLTRFRTAVLRQESTWKLMVTAHELGIAHHLDNLVIKRLPLLQQALHDNPLLKERIDYIAVNISSDSVSSPERLEALIENFQTLQIDRSRFCLEFTEIPGNDSLSDTDNVTAATERLTRELGLRIFIDDFGSGLSNYRRICEAWYDSVKLDMNLVAGIGDSFRLQRYVGSLIETLHSLGKTVVCEGVEDFADFATAIRLGSDAVQGFLISRPINWEAIPGFLMEAEWASAAAITPMVAKIRSSDRLLLPDPQSIKIQAPVPLERQILDNWFELRSFEEFVLLFVNELKRWGLDILRLSLAFLPDEDDIDCSQYVWLPAKPGEVTTLRMDRAFLQQEEHLNSALHHIASRARFYRQRLAAMREVEFSFLELLKEQGCSDYLGIRLDSRGISIPVLTIGLRGESSFSDEQIQRIVSMSSLLSLLFYTFESERAKRLALLDALTNLPNRRSFDSFLKANITAARTNKTKLALALVDIDRFKLVNDTLGHAYGDACLRELGTILNSDLRRDRDFVARLGGEEFAVILPDTSGEEARQLCEVLREAVTRARVTTAEGHEGLPLSISLGIAVWDPASSAECDGDLLQQLADDCLYEAKRQGRNRVVCRPLPS